MVIFKRMYLFLFVSIFFVMTGSAYALTYFVCIQNGSKYVLNIDDINAYGNDATFTGTSKTIAAGDTDWESYCYKTWGYSPQFTITLRGTVNGKSEILAHVRTSGNGSGWTNWAGVPTELSSTGKNLKLSWTPVRVEASYGDSLVFYIKSESGS